MTGPPTVDIHVDNRLTRTSCPLSPCLSALFEKISTSSDKHLRHGTAYSGNSAFWNIKLSCYTFVFHDLGICDRIRFAYPQTIHSVGIRSKTSFAYPQTFHSVGIRSKTSLAYPQTFLSVSISSKTSFTYPQTFPNVGISNKISNSYP